MKITLRFYQAVHDQIWWVLFFNPANNRIKYQGILHGWLQFLDLN